MNKQAKIFSLFLSDAGIPTALFFIMLELVGINAYSIHYVLHSQHPEIAVINWVFAGVGAIAYSITTVVVMHRPGHKQLKITLPVLDAFLVLFGLNINVIPQIEAGTVNYIAVALSILLALFTGVITYSLGRINNESKDKSDADKLQTLVSKLQTDLNIMQTENRNLQTNLDNLQTDLNKSKALADKYKHYFVKAESSRIRRKKPENRTEPELQILKQYQHEN